MFGLTFDISPMQNLCSSGLLYSFITELLSFTLRYSRNWLSTELKLISISRSSDGLHPTYLRFLCAFVVQLREPVMDGRSSLRVDRRAPRPALMASAAANDRHRAREKRRWTRQWLRRRFIRTPAAVATNR